MTNYWRLILAILFLSTYHLCLSQAEEAAAPTVKGYKGIWFTLGQFYDYGDKYSGGLGTYTAKHRPLALYDEKVDKTFFVYGGTTKPKAKHLLCMIGSYDHATGLLSKPRIVFDKMGVDDPHDNPSIAQDEAGYIWVFVSGRGRSRPGYKFRSRQPHRIEAFEQVSEEEMTYPQIWSVPGKGFFHFFTKYTGVRELYFETSSNGYDWSADRKLAGIIGQPGEKSGHYQVSHHHGEKVATFFSRHPNGNVDRRTNLYYLESLDMGQTWQTAAGDQVAIPVVDVQSPALVKDYQSLNNNVYLKDMQFDSQGRPICLYLRSGGHEPGPDNAPREWCVSFWRDGRWQTQVVTQSDHNYDMGSLWVARNKWTMIAPTQDGPQLHGGGGEIEQWVSDDGGENWTLSKKITNDSRLNHNYVREVQQGHSSFLYFWADGNPDQFSRSRLYFADEAGQVFQMPYKMRKEWAKPKRLR